MKLTIEQSDQYSEVEITIKCGQIDATLDKLISDIRLYGFSIVGKKDGATYMVKLEDIFYFESIDDKTYIYCEKDVYECVQKLYELEEKLSNINFQRISKSYILNVHKLLSVRPMIYGKLEAKLENGEKVIVTRHYVEGLKEKMNF